MKVSKAMFFIKMGITMATEEQVEISRIELKKIVNFLPYPIIISEKVGGEFFHLFFNKNFNKKIGYIIDEVPTRTDLLKLIFPDDFLRTEITQQWASREKQIKETGKGHVKIKAHLSCKTGEKKWFEIKSSIVKELHIIAFVDIDVMLQEKLRKNNLNNDRMLTILGHDLRSPIANLISISSLGEQSEISQQEFISMMKILKVESIEALQLLDTTFSWARLNFNYIQYRKVRIDFDELINNALKVNKATYENKSITIAVDIEKLNAIEDDLEILTTIVRNILSNAIKFTSENGLISIKALENELIINDNGIGMSTEMLDAVLSQNYRSRRGTNNEKGIGLGLRLVLTLAEKINCRIIIASTVLVGTSVRIIFDTPRH